MFSVFSTLFLYLSKNLRKMKNIYFSVLLITSLLLSSVTCQAKVKLPVLLADHMIMQQKSVQLFWGKADNNRKVTVTTSWNNKKYITTSDKEGKWSVKITTPEAGGPYRIDVSDGENLTLRDILIGEVWICSGQSNMEMPMKGFNNQPVLGSNNIIAKSVENKIRLFSIPRSSSLSEEEDCQGIWTLNTPEMTSNFSATAYFFGKLLSEVLNVPIGLINTSWGGSKAEAWMSREALKPFTGVSLPVKPENVVLPAKTPMVLYNAMMHPLIHFNVKGFIWYQGEDNRLDPELYLKLLPAMVQNWRDRWENQDLAFYYAQISPYSYGSPRQKSLNTGYMREVQQKLMDIIPNSGMACLLDAGDYTCIHPANKQAAGERLAYWALAKSYQIKGIGYCSPAYKKHVIQNDSVLINLDNIENGLTSYNKPITGFEMAGEDHKFYPANAIVKKNQVIVTSKEVSKPVAVRYCFHHYAEGNLYATNGLPVAPFRTDHWDGETE